MNDRGSLRPEEQGTTRFVKWGIGCGCIVLIVAVLFPILFPRHETAYVVSCISNMKQVGQGVLMYAQDYDEHFPRASVWMDATYPYIKNRLVYRCPVIDASRTKDFGYAFQSALALTSVHDQKAPEKALMIFESNDLHWNANASGRTGVANPPRHQGGDVFGFVDGHAKWQRLIGSVE